MTEPKYVTYTSDSTGILLCSNVTLPDAILVERTLYIFLAQY